jgi:hypothetical protein
MLEVIRTMTPDQWMTNLIFPLVVAILLLLLAFIGSKLMAFFKHLFNGLPLKWWSVRMSLRELFMSKKEKKRREELIQRALNAASQQTNGLTSTKHTIKVPPFTLDSQALRHIRNKK